MQVELYYNCSTSGILLILALRAAYKATKMMTHEYR